jgi:hypothetical protein
VDDRTKTARRSVDQATAGSETAVRETQVSYTTAMGNVINLSAKLLEMLRANAEATLEATTQIAGALADLAQAWSTQATRQFAMLTDQARELTGIWQKFFVPAR